MSTSTTILFTALLISIFILSAYFIQKVMLARSEIVTPDIDYMNKLEQDVKTLRKRHHKTLQAEGELLNRITSLQQVAKTLREETAEPIFSYSKSNFLDFREKSERLTTPEGNISE
ncbi:hypothetical protein [Nocardiopsis sp. NPDC006938]|uniref:hypothetical protein n=1 Tax=Nocardiopsis sp. NPDC006938 TaxID=3364337 RepID=UPI0036C0F834